MLLVSLQDHKYDRMNLSNNNMNKIILNRIMKIEIIKINITMMVLKHSHKNDNPYFMKNKKNNFRQKKRIILIIERLINKTKINN